MQYLAEALRLTINKCLPAFRTDKIQMFIDFREEIFQLSVTLIDVPDIGSCSYTKYKATHKSKGMENGGKGRNFCSKIVTKLPLEVPQKDGTY